MPSAASSLMRFAGAARSAAATASRFARLAERAALSTKAAAVERHTPSLDSHHAATVDPRLHRPPAVVPRPAMTAPASQTLSNLEGKIQCLADRTGAWFGHHGKGAGTGLPIFGCFPFIFMNSGRFTTLYIACENPPFYYFIKHNCLWPAEPI